MWNWLKKWFRPRARGKAIGMGVDGIPGFDPRKGKKADPRDIERHLRPFLKDDPPSKSLVKKK